MRVLLIEGQPGAGASSRRRLIAAGHDVTTCHDVDRATFPCRGLLDDDHCPLEEAPVDAALLARSEDAGRQLASEIGVNCALRHHIPLITVGPDERSPYHDHTCVRADSPDGVVEAVERAQHHPLPRHTEVARRALREVLDRHDLRDVDASGWVERRGGDLRVHLLTSAPVSDAIQEMAAVRAVGAIRRFDPYADVIDVQLDDGT